MLIPVTLTFWLHALTSQLLKAEIFVSPTSAFFEMRFFGWFSMVVFLEAKSSSMAKVWTLATPKGDQMNQFCVAYDIWVYILACSEGFFSGGIA